ncbi:hypothetical protein DVH24_030402 [Malus domestica]|uniref:Protein DETOXIFICATION n=1 Tax=Malus domestica TaxID=3750 RepID=A0A498KA69_MALDO|nr:hypothetical protein DVH24_030402 [Malus domestica]
MFVGHLGELELSSASMASSFANVTGFSVLVGAHLEMFFRKHFWSYTGAFAVSMFFRKHFRSYTGAFAVSILLEARKKLSNMSRSWEWEVHWKHCGQAYGAKQYRMLGVHMQKAMLILLAVSIPLSLIWFYTSDILMALHQDHEISAEAGTFNRWMIPSLFAFSLLQCLNRFLQTQDNVFPMMITSGVTAFLHIAVCWGLIFKSGLRNKGAALAISISHWLNVVLVASYVLFSPACKKTWTGFSKQALHDIFSFASAVMLCLNTCWMVYTISVGLGSAISTRVSNELGAGRPQGAKLALRVMTVMALLQGAAIAIATVLIRHVWGKLYSNEHQVIKYVAKMMLLLAVSDFLDGFQCVLSGAARGCGWQNLCVAINLIAYYAVRIPTAVVFAFVLHIGGMGLWMGIICGLVVQLTALVVVNLRTDWNKEFLISGNEGCQSCSEYHLSHRQYDLGNLMRQIKAIFSSVFDRNVLS